jgi:hypothetical protein
MSLATTLSARFGSHSVVRLLIWAPLALYALLVLIYVALASFGVETIMVQLDIFALGSFTFFFYVSYLALWKVRRNPLRRLILAAIFPFAPLPVLALLDFAGIELITIPRAHGLALPSTTFWFAPGMFMAEPFQLAVRRLQLSEPTTPAQTYVRGAFEQPDGSLILYGATAAGPAGSERETFKLLARIDAAGNVDRSFKPVVVDVPSVFDAFKQPDGTVLVATESPRTQYPRIVEILSNGSVKEIVRVTDYPNENEPQLRLTQVAGAPVPLLPGWLSMQPKLIRLRADGNPDDPFNTQAAKVLGEQHLGDYYAAALGTQGKIVTVASRRGLLRLDATGQLLAPGAVVFDQVQIGQRQFRSLAGVAFHPDGSIFVSAGDESSDAVLPRLMRFDANLREDRAFSDATSSLVPGAGRFHVLAFREGGRIAVSVVERMRGSRILILGPRGTLIREISL